MIVTLMCANLIIRKIYKDGSPSVKVALSQHYNGSERPCKRFLRVRIYTEQEMVLALIKAVKKISKCETDGQCINYLQNAIKYHFSNLCKKNMQRKKCEEVCCENNVISYTERYTDVDFIYDLTKLGENFSQTQIQILEYMLNGYTDREIADTLNLSRQYVNRIKKKLIKI